MPNIEARSRGLAARIKRQLSDIPGVQLKTNAEPALSAAVVKFKLRNRPTKDAYDALWHKHRIALALTPAGDAEGLRYSPQIYNSCAEIDRAVAAVSQGDGVTRPLDPTHDVYWTYLYRQNTHAGRA